MAGPLFCADNFFNPIEYQNHVVTALTQVVDPTGANDHSVFHVGCGRRSQFNYWQSATVNTADWVQVQCDRVRAANFIALDRGHNLGGSAIFLQCSDDGVLWQTILPGGGASASPGGLVIPAFSQPNVLTDTTYGVTTLEGAWACSFPTVAALYWRLYIPAMGANLTPAVVGLYLGTAYTPFGGALFNPWSEDQDDFVAQETVSHYGWRGRTQKNQVKAGQARIRLQTPDEYDLARYHIQDLFGAGRPTWLCYDMAQADRMILVVRPVGRFGFVYQPRWFPQQAEVNYVEHEPAFPT